MRVHEARRRAAARGSASTVAADVGDGARGTMNITATSTTSPTTRILSIPPSMRAIIAQRRSTPRAARPRVRCARMTRNELEKRLLGADDCEAVLAALADFFAAHELVFGHGTDNASDEAFWLLRHVQRWRDDLDWSSPPEREVALAALDLAVQRVETRKPLAYLARRGVVRRFAVCRRRARARAALAARGGRSSAVSRRGARCVPATTCSTSARAAAASRSPSRTIAAEVLVDATDVSVGALEVAAANVARHALGERVALHHADLFPPTRRAATASSSRILRTSPRARWRSFRRSTGTSRQLALAGGASGFEPAERILRGALSRLAPDGCVFVEVGAGAEAFAAAHPRLAATWLTFDRGGDGVFVLTAAELEEFLRRR